MKRNYARFYCLLKEVMSELDREEAKELLADQVSGGRTSSVRELTDEEFDQAVSLLSSKMKEGSSAIRKARSKALHLLQMYGVDTTDWDKVNAFVQSPRIAGKEFYYLSSAELEKLTNKMRAILSKQGEKQDEKHKKEANFKLYYVRRKNRVLTN